MKLKKSRIEEIVKEELAAHLRELLLQSEADEPDEEEKGGTVVAADRDNAGEEGDTPSANMAPSRGTKGDDTPDGEQRPPEDSPVAVAGADPTDNAGEDEPVPSPEKNPTPAEEEPPPEEPEPEDTEDIGGDISAEIVGKTIQAITLEPESKIMAGAAEITIQFDEIPHPLKIIIGTSGMIKYLFRGSLHNEL